MAYGTCDVKDCEGKTFKCWRPLSEPFGNAKQLCKRCWVRHVDPGDPFDLFDEFGFRRPQPDRSKEIIPIPRVDDERDPERCGPNLQRFIKNECASCISGQCDADRPCEVIEYSQRCEYFEKSVLPSTAYPFKHLCFVKNPTFERMVRSEYAEIKPDSNVGTRFCDCGNPLPKRRRFCDKCKAKHRRDTKRIARMKKAG